MLIGAVAAVLAGGAGVPPVGVVELVADAGRRRRAAGGGVAPSVLETPFGVLHARQRWFAPDSSTWDLELVEGPAGTHGYADLAERATTLVGVPVRVSGTLDLLRIAHASPGRADRARAVELNAVLEARRARAVAAA